nr:MAG TPA: hypothetical protein [Bacteriophage sp.]
MGLYGRKRGAQVRFSGLVDDLAAGRIKRLKNGLFSFALLLCVSGSIYRYIIPYSYYLVYLQQRKY